MDAEVVRMITLVKNLVNEARQWDESRRALEDGGKIVDLFSVKAIAQASILSMVSKDMSVHTIHVFNVYSQVTLMCS